MAHEKKTLWVGDVMSYMDEAYLVNLFSQAGGVTGAKVIRDKGSTQPVGYGFVEFESHEKAAKVLQLFSTSVNPATNKPFKLNWGVYGGTGITGNGMSTNSNIGYTPPTFSAQPPKSYMSAYTQQPDMQRGGDFGGPIQIYVGDLDITVDNEALLNHFKARCPNAQSSRIIVDIGTQLSKGYGFVTFVTKQDAEEAMQKMNGTYLRGKPIKVKESFQRTSTSSGTSGAGAVKKEKMTPLQIQKMYQTGGMNESYGMQPMMGADLAAQQQQINMQQYQYMIALQQQQILQQQQLLFAQQQQQAKKEAEAEKEKQLAPQSHVQIPSQVPMNALDQLKIQQQQHASQVVYYQQLAAQNPAYMPYLQQVSAAYQMFMQAYGAQLMTPTIQQAQIAPVRITSPYTKAIIVSGQTVSVPIQGQIPAQTIPVVNPGVIVAGIPQIPVNNSVFLTAQPSMLRKRDSPQQVFSNSQKKLKKESEKSEADDCPQIATIMFMNEFNVDAYQVQTKKDCLGKERQVRLEGKYEFI